MINIIILILSVFCTIPCIAQSNKIWPYSKAVYYINITDSNNITTRIARRTTIIYDTAGRVLSNFYEENNTQLDTNNFKKLGADTLQYDNKGRLLRKINYAFRDGWPEYLGGEDSVYIDSANFTGSIKYYRSKNNQLSPDRWKVIYKNTSNQDSVILKGTGGTLFLNPNSKQINYHSNNRIDSSYYYGYNSTGLQLSYLEKFNYSYPDTVIQSRYNSSGALTVIFKFSYNLQNKKLIQYEMISVTNHYLDKYQYYSNDLVEDRKSYRYNFTKKRFELSNTSNKTFDKFGAILRNLSVLYQDYAFYNGNLHLYFYTLRQPTANFSTINKCFGDSVNFTDESKDAQTYLWDFGDGQTSALKSPKHFYSKPGTYNVKLKVTANSGLKDSVIKQLVIYPQPEAGFTITKDTLQSSAYTYIFTPKDTTQKNYLWHFGDSSISSKSKIAKYTFPNAANYKVSLQVTNENNCFAAADTLLTVTSSIDELRTGHDLDFSVYPNPFSKELTITYNKLNDNSPLTIYITDVTGKEIMNITNPNELTGKQLLRIDASGINLKPGIYFIKLVSGNINTHKKAIFIK